jgi:hypothetical protein
MRATVRIAALVLSGLLGLASGVAVTGTKIDPIDTVTSVVSSVSGQTTVLSGIVSTASTATGPVDDAVSGTSGAGETGLGEAAKIKTMFDRLPRRFEVLLERIEMGRNVRASLRRLERALAAAPPRLRARVLRLLRAELRRLEQGGVAPAERARVKRLRRLLTELTRPGGAAGSASDSLLLHRQRGDQPGGVSSGPNAATSTTAGGSPFTGSLPRSSSPSKAREHSEDGRGGLSLPPGWESRVPVLPLVLAVFFLALLALLLAAVSESLPRGRLRGFVRRSRIALALAGATTIIALTLILFL